MTQSDVDGLKHLFAAAGLDPTGIDLEWLSGFKTDTEQKIAAARAQAEFATARPVFIPPKDKSGAHS